eukprot:TRINITY_DN13721_c0_g1_i2.p1 TRINITY_DN13721_c0_g1~~TRINITY_DN13721_c0_g1_i2.p1  ORF type:complete len:256 (-),score=16.50 TRINITY_DN13721_c0_g1_i2:880-1587(-)
MVKRYRQPSSDDVTPRFCSSYSVGKVSCTQWNSDLKWNQNWNWRSRAARCTCAPPRSWSTPPVGYIDTHCHLEGLDHCEELPWSSGRFGYDGWWERSGKDAAGVVRHVLEMQPSAVLAVISNCCDPLDFEWYEGLMRAWDSHEFRDDRLYWTVGIHPYSARDFEARLDVEPQLEQRMMALASHPRCVGIGECGLDYCKASETHKSQKNIFERMCRHAVRLGKTLIVHARDAPRGL